MKKIVLIIFITVMAGVVIMTVILIFISKNISNQKTLVRSFTDKRRGNPYPELKFEIDCSRINNEEGCNDFIYKLEHELYPEMKRITGIDLRWCYDTVRALIVPKGPEFIDMCGPEAGGCVGPGARSENEAGFVYPPSEVPCNLHPHELHHIFDHCISNYIPILEVMTRAGRLAARNVCPEYKEEFPLYWYIIEDVQKQPDNFSINNCRDAQVEAIYNGTEAFFKKFYEYLLRKKLDDPKTKKDITQAILYAGSATENINKYCLND